MVWSNCYCVSSRVVQGSNLGTLLFLIFYSYVVSRLSCNAFAYADDLKTLTLIRSFSDCLALQDDLDSLVYWGDNNKLQLNVKKCKKISFTRYTRNIEYSYNISAVPLGYFQHSSNWRHCYWGQRHNFYHTYNIFAILLWDF